MKTQRLFQCSGRFGLGILLLIMATACSGSQSAAVPRLDTVGTNSAHARIEIADSPLQCVPYARARSGLNIHGDAWTWWQSAEGRFHRDRTPRPGAVLVLSRSQYTHLGHLAVVAKVLGPREILVEHANWLNKGNIHHMAPVRDVSLANDWSAVRDWYIPGDQLGARTYPASGFIHPTGVQAALESTS